MRGITSKQHEEVVKLVCNIFIAKPVIITGNNSIRGLYFPDARTKRRDFEIEVVPRTQHIIRKSNKWNKKRRKILILTPNKKVTKLFDETFIEINGELINIKTFKQK